MRPLRTADEILGTLRERGWHKGGFTSDYGRTNAPVCALGACTDWFSSDSYTENVSSYADRLASVILEQYPEYREDAYCKFGAWIPFVGRWNDAPERTVEEVEAVIEKAFG